MGLLALPPVVDNDPSSYDDNQCDLSEQENQMNEAINSTEPEDDDVESEAHGENEEVPATSENNCSKENEPLRGDIAEVTENMSFQPKNNTSNVKPESLPLKSGSHAGAGDGSVSYEKKEGSKSEIKLRCSNSKLCKWWNKQKTFVKIFLIFNIVLLALTIPAVILKPVVKNDNISSANDELNTCPSNMFAMEIDTCGIICTPHSISSLSQLLASNELSFNINIIALKNHHVNILSMYNNKLLVSASLPSILYSLILEPACNMSIIYPSEEHIYDAVWTRTGNIVFTSRSTLSNGKVIVINETGNVIHETTMNDPRFLFVSYSKDAIYLADYTTGYYQSVDDGKTWQFLFSPSDNWNVRQVIKVSTDIIWASELRTASTSEYRLRIYSGDRGHFDGNVTWKDVHLNLPLVGNKQINLAGCKLFFDGNSSMFLSDSDNNAVYLLFTDGQYNRQILSSKNISSPYALTVDKNHKQLLYVGQKLGVIGVFKFV